MSEWKGESVLTFLELSAISSRFASWVLASSCSTAHQQGWPAENGLTGTLPTSMAPGPSFLPPWQQEDAARKLLPTTHVLSLPLFSWAGWKVQGSRGGRLGRAVVGAGRRFITWERQWEGSTGHGVRLEVQRPGFLSTWFTTPPVINSHHALALIPWEYHENHMYEHFGIFVHPNIQSSPPVPRRGAEEASTCPSACFS